MKSLRSLITALFLFVATLGAEAAEISIGSLNAFHLFDPIMTRKGVTAEGNRYSVDVYQRKLANLGSMFSSGSPDFVAVQEIGGREEAEALSKQVGYGFSFVKGRDTYTGQNVALLSRLASGFRSTTAKRVSELDRVVSKHALVRISSADSERPLYVLAVHLLRPIGENQEKHAAQLQAIARWADTVIELDPASVVVIVGDFNSRETNAAQTILGPTRLPARDIGADTGFQATHLDGRPYDRIIVIGDNVKVSSLTIQRPPYGKRPNDSNKLLWTDHFYIQAQITY